MCEFKCFHLKLANLGQDYQLQHPFKPRVMLYLNKPLVLESDLLIAMGFLYFSQCLIFTSKQRKKMSVYHSDRYLKMS